MTNMGIQSKMTSCHRIRKNTWRNHRGNKLTGRSSASVEQPVRVTSMWYRQITSGVDTAEWCGQASRDTKVQSSWDAEAGVPYTWDDGRRLLASKGAQGKPMTIDSRHADSIVRLSVLGSPDSLDPEFSGFPDSPFSPNVSTSWGGRGGGGGG